MAYPAGENPNLPGQGQVNPPPAPPAPPALPAPPAPPALPAPPAPPAPERVRIGAVLVAAKDIATVLIGSGVLSLPWSFAQLGWGMGWTVLILFAVVAMISGWILAGTYQVMNPQPQIGDANNPNSSYSRVVKRIYGNWQAIACRCLVCVSIFGTCVVYAITVESSFRSVFHIRKIYCLIICCAIQMVYCIAPRITCYAPWLPRFITFVSVMLCVSYPVLGVSVAGQKIHARGTVKFSTFGVPNKDALIKIGRVCMAISNIGFSFNYLVFAFQIQASFAQLPIRSMKISTLIGLTFTTLLYGCFASITYGAFGDSTPANILSNSGNGLSYAANTCVVLHLLLDFKEYGLLVFESIERHFHVDGEIWWQRCVSALGRIMFVILTYVAAGRVPKFLLWSGLVTAFTCFPLFAVGPFVIYQKQHENNIRKSGLFLLYGYLFVSIVMVLFLVAGTVFYLIKVYHKFDY